MNREVIRSFIVFLVLVAIGGVRFFVKFDATFISCINFVGAAVALVSLLLSISEKVKERHKPFLATIIVICLVACIITAVLILTSIIIVDEKWDDIITLSALALSLSTPFWVELFSPERK